MGNMKDHNEKIASMTFASVYPHYVNKVERKGRSKEELHQVIYWLTGYNEEKINQLIHEKVTFSDFFQLFSTFSNFSRLTTPASTSCACRFKKLGKN